MEMMVGARRGAGVPQVKNQGQACAERIERDARATDLGIIGGGPAGTAAALEARRRGMRVALWERDGFPRDKVCGEFLSPESIDLLRSTIPVAMARAAVIRRSEFISKRGHALRFELARPARGLSRRVLDEALWNAAAAAGVETRESNGAQRVGRIRSATRETATWEIVSEKGPVSGARALILACGRWWALDGICSPARENRNEAAGPWMGAKAHFSGVAPRDAVEMYYFPGGYCGVAPVEDGMYNVCCLVHRSVAGAGRASRAAHLGDFAAWLAAITRHPVLAARLRGAMQVTSTVSTAPLRPARRRTAMDGALMAGDAAGFLDPFTGDGISMALHSGRLAAAELATALSNENRESESRHSRGSGNLEWDGNDRQVAQAAASYRRQLNRAVRRSYLVAGLLRCLVSAPARVQSLASVVLERMGARLLVETRWRG